MYLNIKWKLFWDFVVYLFVLLKSSFYSGKFLPPGFCSFLFHSLYSVSSCACLINSLVWHQSSLSFQSLLLPNLFSSSRGKKKKKNQRQELSLAFETLKRYYPYAVFSGLSVAMTCSFSCSSEESPNFLSSKWPDHFCLCLCSCHSMVWKWITSR